jgi:hypothetical protein
MGKANDHSGKRRKQSSQKTAWTQGTNPITQRPTNQNVPNGVVTAAKSSAGPKSTDAAVKETNTPDQHANDRLMFLLANFKVSATACQRIYFHITVFHSVGLAKFGFIPST